MQTLLPHTYFGKSFFQGKCRQLRSVSDISCNSVLLSVDNYYLYQIKVVVVKYQLYIHTPPTHKDIYICIYFINFFPRMLFLQIKKGKLVSKKTFIICVYYHCAIFFLLHSIQCDSKVPYKFRIVTLLTKTNDTYYET